MKAENSLLTSIKTATYTPLPFSVYNYSSFSGSYHPRNICVDDPTEQSSRWSSNSHDQSQYITIKLNKPSVACEILFGKFHRSHVCNLKEFKVFGGLDPNDMKELLHSGLTDDSKPETFSLRYTYNDLIFPVQYLKIMPIATFGTNFNYSIWYVEIRGIQDRNFMSRVYDAYECFKEMETIRLCLKHFRQRNLMDIYNLLQEKSNIELEHPLIGQLHKAVVMEGDFEAAEQIVLNAESQGIFKCYVEEAKYLPTWYKINASNDDGDSPCARGGHQICIDAENDRIYLFGGWDGKRELSDFWCYNIKSNRWKLISSDTAMQGGPSARSCHTMCFDPIKKSIYVLGRYVEVHPISNTTDSLPKIYEPDFYQYFIDLDQWIKISDNTQIDGGPSLLCDHQMCVDPIGRKLYVFGGRVMIPGSGPFTYSGFYSFDVDTCKWSLIRYDINNIQHYQSPIPPSTHLTPNTIPIGRRRSSNGSYVPSFNASQTIKSRAGHTMLMDVPHRCIYIFSGQRGKETLTDLYRYSITEDKITEIAQDFSKDDGSEFVYTQRATINVERQEIYILSGILKSKPCNHVRNYLWIYSICNNKWEKVYESSNEDPSYWQRTPDIEPCPRYTHQMVYSKKSSAHFIFGGNPGDLQKPCRRLGDFWKLKLAKPDSKQVVRQIFYLLRTRKLNELCKRADKQFVFKGQRIGQQNVSEETMQALQYLREYVTPIIDYENKQEVEHFKKLCTHLCISEDIETKSQLNLESDVYYTERTSVFEELLKFFPSHMKEPEGSLIDAVKIA